LHDARNYRAISPVATLKRISQPQTHPIPNLADEAAIQASAFRLTNFCLLVVVPASLTIPA